MKQTLFKPTNHAFEADFENNKNGEEKEREKSFVNMFLVREISKIKNNISTILLYEKINFS